MFVYANGPSIESDRFLVDLAVKMPTSPRAHSKIKRLLAACTRLAEHVRARAEQVSQAVSDDVAEYIALGLYKELDQIRRVVDDIDNGVVTVLHALVLAEQAVNDRLRLRRTA